MRAAKFSIDFLEGEVFEGYTRGEEWNGFACPYFTFDQAQRLVEAWRTAAKEANYDAEGDQFIFHIDGADKEDCDSFSAIEDNGMTLYPIGNSCWIWEEVQ